MLFRTFEECADHLEGLGGLVRTCFLCGEREPVVRLTAEHVFPQWLLKHFGIRETHLTLLNGTEIKYNQLLVPCCTVCNRHHLGQLERNIRDAFFRGYKSFAKLDEWSLYLWLVKILVAILIKEAQLPIDRREQLGTRIVEPAQLRQLDFLHMLLQITRRNTFYHGRPPGSVFIFPCLQPAERTLRFDFIDNPRLQLITLYLGRICIVASLMDRRALADIHPHYWSPYQSFPIHPIQYREIAAHFIYKRHLLRDMPGHTLISSPTKETVHIVAHPLSGEFTRQAFEDWDTREYHSILHQLIGFPLEKLEIPDGQHVTWLRNADGKPLQLNFQEFPAMTFPHDQWEDDPRK